MVGSVSQLSIQKTSFPSNSHTAFSLARGHKMIMCSAVVVSWTYTSLFHFLFNATSFILAINILWRVFFFSGSSKFFFFILFLILFNFKLFRLPSFQYSRMALPLGWWQHKHNPLHKYVKWWVYFCLVDDGLVPSSPFQWDTMINCWIIMVKKLVLPFT